MNEDHSTWEVPHTNGETINASFDELYSSALERAREILPAYANADFGFAECESFVSNVNFLGRAVEQPLVDDGQNARMQHKAKR